jgi:repressor of nif and glnA expression
MLEDEQMGRRHLVEKLKAYGLALTENEVRGAIKRLADHGMVETMVGRAGTKITVNGKHYLSERV